MTTEEKQTARIDFLKNNFPAKPGAGNVTINITILTQIMASLNPSDSLAAEVAVKGEEFIKEAFKDGKLEDDTLPPPDYVCPPSLCGAGCPSGWICLPETSKRKKRSAGICHLAKKE